MMDEMVIRKKVEWNGHKFHGYVDMRTNMDDDGLPEAKKLEFFSWLHLTVDGKCLLRII